MAGGGGVMAVRGWWGAESWHGTRISNSLPISILDQSLSIVGYAFLILVSFIELCEGVPIVGKIQVLANPDVVFKRSARK